MTAALYPGEGQEDEKVCRGQTFVEPERHSTVRRLHTAMCLLASRLCPRKENQLKQKKKDEEAREKAVRRVYVIFQVSNSPPILTTIWTTLGHRLHLRCSCSTIQPWYRRTEC